MNYNELLTELEDIRTELDLVYLIDKDDTYETFYDKITQYIYEQEIIYYSRAIEYLSANDSSLKESLSLADELGYQVKSLSSELLATLLYQDNLFSELNEISSDLEELFNQYYNQ